MIGIEANITGTMSSTGTLVQEKEQVAQRPMKLTPDLWSRAGGLKLM